MRCTGPAPVADRSGQILERLLAGALFAARVVRARSGGGTTGGRLLRSRRAVPPLRRPATLTVGETAVQVAPATAVDAVSVGLPPRTAVRRHLVEGRVIRAREARQLAVAHLHAHHEYVLGHNLATLAQEGFGGVRS